MNFFYRFIVPVLLILLVAALWTPSPVMTQNEEHKFGYIDFLKILDEYDEVQKLKELINTEKDRIKNKEDRFLSELKSEMERFNQQRGFGLAHEYIGRAGERFSAAGADGPAHESADAINDILHDTQIVEDGHKTPEKDDGRQYPEGELEPKPWPG